MINNKKQDLLHGHLRPIFLRYLFPSIAATVMISLNFFVDTLCIGQKIGESGLASLNFAMPSTGVLYAIGCLLGAGAATLFSAHIGRGEKHEARQVFTIATITSVSFSVVVMVLGLLFLPQIATFLGAAGDARQGTMDYLFYVFLFAPFFTAEMFLNIFVRNDNAPRLSMIATLCGSSTNIVLDLLFVFVFDWGMAGASLATSLSLTISTTVLIISALRKRSGLRFAKVTHGFKKLLHILRVGLPSFIIEMTGSIVTLTFNTVLMKLSGEMAVAVYGIMANLTIVVASSLSGVSNAMQPLVSINAGAGKLGRVKEILRLAMSGSIGLGVLYVIIGELWPEMLVRFFVDPTPEFLAMACTGIRIVFLAYLISGTNILLSVYFQATQSNNAALSASVMRGIISPVICVVGCAFFFGVTGVWVSTVVAEILTLMFSIFTFAKVQRRLRAKNYEALGYFNNASASETIDTILARLGAEDLDTFAQLMKKCDARDENIESIPAIIALDDLTISGREKKFTPAPQDEELGLVLAVGALLFTNLYEQKPAESKDYPPVAKALTALCEKCFRFEGRDIDGDDDKDDFEIIPYEEVRSTYPKTKDEKYSNPF
ncbi:MAG: MATE family efflux transporter [Oscillospiraceae bacterium]